MEPAAYRGGGHLCIVITAIAGCAEPVVKPSVQRGQSVRLGLESDKAKSVVTIIHCVLDIARNNKETTDSIIDKVAGSNSFLKLALKLAVCVTTTKIPESLIMNILSFLGSLARIFDALQKLFSL